MIPDMTEALERQLEEMTAELLDRYEELTVLYELGASLASEFDVDRIAEIAVRRAAEATGAGKGIVALEREDGLYAAALLGAVRLTPGGLTEYVARTGRELLLHEDEPGPDGVARDVADGAVLSVPLAPPGDASPLGALTLATKTNGGRFSAGDAKLANAVASQLAAAVYRSRLVSSLRATEAVRRELEIAAGIQRTLLPSAPPAVEGAEIAALCMPAANVGGDYYDFVVDGEGRVSFVIADVAGHSIGSALMMAMARSILRRELAEGNDPASVLGATNGALFDDLVRSALFLTVFCARFDPATGLLEYANGGHNPPLVRRSSGGHVELDADGAAVGILRDVEFEPGALALDVGDTLLLYTDGVTEAIGPDGEQFGEERLRATFGDLRPQELVDTLYSASRAHAGVGSAQGDDVTLVAVRREETA